MTAIRRTQWRMAESQAGVPRTSREKTTLDSMLSGLLTTSEILSKSAHFLDSCNPLWGACQPPINSRSMRNQMTANKPGESREGCGPEVKSKVYPFPAELKQTLS